MSQYLSVSVILVIQYATGMAIAAPLLIRRGWQGFATQRAGLHFFRGLCGLGGFYTFYLALTQIPLAEATLLRTAAPLCVPLVTWIWLRVTVPYSRWIPLSIGFLGVLLILRPLPGSISTWHLVGFSSAILLSISMVATRRLVQTESTPAILFYYFATALVTTLPLAIVHWKQAPVSIWLITIAIGAGLSLAMSLYTMTFRYAKPSTIAPVTYFGVVFSGVWGWLFWQQVPHLLSIAGAALVVSSAFITLIIGDDNPDKNQ